MVNVKLVKFDAKKVKIKIKIKTVSNFTFNWHSFKKKEFFFKFIIYKRKQKKFVLFCLLLNEQHGGIINGIYCLEKKKYFYNYAL